MRLVTVTAWVLLTLPGLTQVVVPSVVEEPAGKKPVTTGSGEWVLVIHGGAGSTERGNLSADKEQAYRQALTNALQLGAKILSTGGTSVDAVEAVVKYMEDDSLFNAGKGAVLNAGGKAELDASIMDGNTGMAGAVACVTTIKNPVSAARLVMDKSPHVLLVGSGAENFAGRNKLEIVDPAYFITRDRLDAWKKWKKANSSDLDEKDPDEMRNGKVKEVEKNRDILKEKELKKSRELEKQKELEKKKINDKADHGTVGAVARDQWGNLAAATSTGGMMGKMPGRVGDTPLIGAGTYANNKTCAISGTGHGEYFIRNLIAYDISALMEYRGMGLQEAANYVIQEKLKEKSGTGGVIGIDREGHYTMIFNTPSMFRGYIRSGEEAHTEIFP